MVQRWYTASLHEKAALRHMLTIWRGREFTPAELEAFDVENVVGAAALLTVQYNESNGTWYANVEGVSRLPKGMAAMSVPDDYVRFHLRPPREGDVERTASSTEVSDPVAGWENVDEQAAGFEEKPDDLPF